ELGEAGDRRQHVVEVVRNAGGELAHRLEPVLAAQLRLELALLRPVDPEPLHVERLALRVGHERASTVNPSDAAVRRDELELVRPRSSWTSTPRSTIQR